MLKVFVVLSSFRIVLSFASFLVLFILNCDSIVFVWFSFASRCYICNFKMFIIIIFPRRTASARCTSSA